MSMGFPKAFLILVCFNLLFLVFSFVIRDNIKTDFNQMNDNLNEKSIQNALGFPVKPTIWFSLKRQELNIKGKFLLFPINLNTVH